MLAKAPHFLLYSQASGSTDGARRWRFVLQPVGSDSRFSATDDEPETRASRLELLAVVRGLEALDQPSRVTLVTPSRYVSRGIRRELAHWRERGWRWERFGQLVPIRDYDLWQRIDRALQFHHVECCAWDAADAAECDEHAMIPAAEAASPADGPALVVVRRTVKRTLPRRRRHRFLQEAIEWLRQGVLAPFSAIWRPPFTRAA